jgi:hypothetical protein
MYMSFTVPIPGKDAGVTTKIIKGTTYVYYERERKYDGMPAGTIQKRFTCHMIQRTSIARLGI